MFLFQGLTKHRQSQAHRKVVAAAKAEKSDAADDVKGKGQQQGKYFVIMGACFNSLKPGSMKHYEKIHRAPDLQFMM